MSPPAAEPLDEAVELVLADRDAARLGEAAEGGDLDRALAVAA